MYESLAGESNMQVMYFAVMLCGLVIDKAVTDAILESVTNMNN